MKLFPSSYVNKSDEELMQLVMDNNLQAFNEIYNRYRVSLYSYLNKNLNSDRVEDLHQEIFYKVIKNKNTFKFESKFKTWIWTIARNTLIDYYRTSENKMKNSFAELTNEDGEESYASALESTEELILNKTTQKQLELCLEELSPEHKEIMLLSIQSELSYEEISKVTGLSIGAIKSIFFRSKEKLIECFKRGGHL